MIARSGRKEMTIMLQLRKGMQTNDRRGMTDLSYFRPRAKEGFRGIGIEDAFRDVYGPEPRAIEAILPQEKVEDVWSWRYEEWDKGGLRHACDGDWVLRYRDPEAPNGYTNKEPGEMPCPFHSGQVQRTKKRPGCKPSGHLIVFLPDLADELFERGLVKAAQGYVEVATTSLYDSLHITGFLNAAYEQTQSMRRPVDGLFGFPLVIRRVKKEIKMSWDGGSKKAEKWMIQLAEVGQYQRMRLLQAREMQMQIATAEFEQQFPEDMNPENDEMETPEPDQEKAPESDDAPQDEESRSWSSEEITGFFSWVATLDSMDVAKAMEVLGVENLKEYAGTPEDARKAVQESLIPDEEPSVTEDEPSYQDALGDQQQWEIPF
jgi:hypothetical protein